MRVIQLAIALLAPIAMPAHATSIFGVPLVDIDGKPASLTAYRGKVLLIVNVASACGLTPQYEGLQQLYASHREQGLVVLGFPCNQFGNQEPGSHEQIKAFCSASFGVDFPLFAKLEVNGPNRHPLYVLLAGETSPFPGDIRWNFAKFLIGRDGRILRRFEPQVKPEAPELLDAVKTALASG